MHQAIALPLACDIDLQNAQPAYDRRLSDKILAAFAHAYEAGELGVAAALRQALEQAEAGRSGAAAERRRVSLRRQADLWIAFVDARNAYKRLAAQASADAGEVAAAGAEMLEAYRRWSEV